MKDQNLKNISIPELGEFYYACLEKIDGMPGNSLNNYYFQNKVLQNQGILTFRHFVEGVKSNSYLADLETSIINLSKVVFIEVKLNQKQIVFYFDNGNIYNCDPPSNLRDSAKFTYLIDILEDIFGRSLAAQKIKQIN